MVLAGTTVPGTVVAETVDFGTVDFGTVVDAPAACTGEREVDGNSPARTGPVSVGDAGTVEGDSPTVDEVTIGDEVEVPGFVVELGMAVDVEEVELDDEELKFTFVVLVVGPGSSTNVTGGLTPTRLSCAATGDKPKAATTTAPARVPNTVSVAHLTWPQLRVPVCTAGLAAV